MTRTATWDSRCPNCSSMIHEGDEITTDPETALWVHLVCPTPHDPLAPRNPVCTACWLDHPPGACDR